MNKEKIGQSFGQFYDKNYKTILIIPIILLIICVGYLFYFTSQNGDVIKKDISLTGGTSIQVNSNTSIDLLKQALSKEGFSDFSVRQVSDILTGEQLAFIIEIRDPPEKVTPFLETYLGFKLDSTNSSIEFTGSSIGGDFYTQLLLAILFAFIFMGTVVFYIFSNNTKIKVLLVVLSLIAPVLFFMMRAITLNQAFIVSFIVLAVSIFFYAKYSIPSMAVVFCAFADIAMTVATVNLLGMQVSSAGVVAFLMLIGYSVDTDILLTTRVLKRHGGTINSKIWGSFKTGITMTLTSISIVIIGLILTSSFSEVLNQIFTILFIGLLFDIWNTWVTNTCMVKWYAEKHKIE